MMLMRQRVMGDDFQLGVLLPPLPHTRPPTRPLARNAALAIPGPAALLMCVQSFEATRGRATDAMAIIRHLQEFSVVQDLGDLPHIFHEQKRQAEAAVSSPEAVKLEGDLRVLSCWPCAVS